ncbi:MAG TPA: NADH-quinone oxidoreductase subunit C [Vicinamibacterales bacterium]|jgi:Ni,Fe-hydrogenase III large subunit/Ni,Fe-hydrogenase III component G
MNAQQALLNTPGVIVRDDLYASSEGRVVAYVHHSVFQTVVEALHQQSGLPLDLLFATDNRAANGTFGLHAVLAVDASHEWIEVVTTLPETDPVYDSLTPTVMAAHWYERYAQDMFGIVAQGHPDPRRLVHHENIPAGTHPLRKDFGWDTPLPHADEPYPLGRVAGEGIFQIPVGPIHAGIIEPGHFRFNVAGERIITLEGKLFFTHKGVEKLLEGKTPPEAMPFVERVSGDSAASHALAFCQAIESVAGCAVAERARLIRLALVEVERFTMHLHDVSNICGMGTGYTVMAANGFRIKERLQRLSARLLGNRFFRGLIVPGGVARDFSDAEMDDVRETLGAAWSDASSLIRLGLDSDTLRDRLETTGVLTRDAAWAYGAKGLAARASGLDRDARRDHPHAGYDLCSPTVRTRTEGDVFARVMVRVSEMEDSVELVRAALGRCRGGALGPRIEACVASHGEALGWAEGWRGQILDWIRLRDGVIDRAVIRDPSFCNWPLFGEMGPGNIVPDFPLCNKSLNLSYSGTDL